MRSPGRGFCNLTDINYRNYGFFFQTERSRKPAPRDGKHYQSSVSLGAVAEGGIYLAGIRRTYQPVGEGESVSSGFTVHEYKFKNLQNKSL